MFVAKFGNDTDHEAGEEDGDAVFGRPAGRHTSASLWCTVPSELRMSASLHGMIVECNLDTARVGCSDPTNDLKFFKF